MTQEQQQDGPNFATIMCAHIIVFLALSCDRVRRFFVPINPKFRLSAVARFRGTSYFKNITYNSERVLILVLISLLQHYASAA